MKTDLSPFLRRLLAQGWVARSEVSANGRELLEPLFVGSVLDWEFRGRGEAIIVRDPVRLREWVESVYPSSTVNWIMPPGAARARAIAQRRDSKAGGADVASAGIFARAPNAPDSALKVDGAVLPVGELTARFGVAAFLVGKSTALAFGVTTALVENFEVFLHSALVMPQVSVVLSSAGKVSDRLIAALARAEWMQPPLWHLPDYDPVGLSDFLRLHAALGDGVRLFVPPDLDERFRRFGNEDLIAGKPRNRELLERLGSVSWPCGEARLAFDLIRETGCGLEQEALLLRLD